MFEELEDRGFGLNRRNVDGLRKIKKARPSYKGHPITFYTRLRKEAQRLNDLHFMEVSTIHISNIKK